MRIPGPPKTPEPPQAVQDALNALQHPGVLQKGLTTTEDGEWALLVRVAGDAEIPGDLAPGVPVIVERAGPPATARPAFPEKGE